jgi:hypothetical protein
MKLTDAEIRLLSDLLWDTDPAHIDTEMHWYPLIERVLVFGRSTHLAWLLERFGLEALGQVVRTSRNLDRKTARYWSVRLAIPEKEVRCFSMS